MPGLRPLGKQYLALASVDVQDEENPLFCLARLSLFFFLNVYTSHLTARAFLSEADTWIMGPDSGSSSICSGCKLQRQSVREKYASCPV